MQLDAPESSVTALVKLCEQAWRRPPTSICGYAPTAVGIDAEGIRDVLKVAVQRGRYALFEKAASQHGGRLPVDFFDWAREWLGDDAEERFKAIQKGYVYHLTGEDPSS